MSYCVCTAKCTYSAINLMQKYAHKLWHKEKSQAIAAKEEIKYRHLTDTRYQLHTPGLAKHSYTASESAVESSDCTHHSCMGRRGQNAGRFGTSLGLSVLAREGSTGTPHTSRSTAQFTHSTPHVCGRIISDVRPYKQKTASPTRWEKMSSEMRALRPIK